MVSIAGERLELGLRNVGVGPLLHASVNLWVLPLDEGFWDFNEIQATPSDFMATFGVIAVGETRAPNAAWQGSDVKEASGKPLASYVPGHLQPRPLVR